MSCVFNKAGVKRELLDTFKARKLAYYGHTIRKQGSCLEKEIMLRTMPGARRRGRPRTACMDVQHQYVDRTPVKESIRMTEDREINGESTSMVWPTLGSRTAKEQNITVYPYFVPFGRYSKKIVENCKFLYFTCTWRSRWGDITGFSQRYLAKLEKTKVQVYSMVFFLRIIGCIQPEPGRHRTVAYATLH